MSALIDVSDPTGSISLRVSVGLTGVEALRDTGRVRSFHQTIKLTNWLAMLNPTISKSTIFVISLAFCWLCSTGCFSTTIGVENGGAKNTSDNSQFYAPEVIATLESDRIRESSGVVSSRCNDGVFWTHNDSGDGPVLYAFDSEGRDLGAWLVRGAGNVDWEDIATSKDAAGKCRLFIGDIGNNGLERNVLVIYIVEEPEVSTALKKPKITEASEAVRFSYPDEVSDAETLMVNPTNGDLYVLTKRTSQRAEVFKLPADYSTEKVNVLRMLGPVNLPNRKDGVLTGGEISSDGKRVILCDYFAGYELTLPGGESEFDLIWQTTPVILDLGKRRQGEAVCYSTDGESVFATSEKTNQPLIRIRRKARGLH